MWGVFRDGIGGISWQNVGGGVGGFSGGMWVSFGVECRVFRGGM